MHSAPPAFTFRVEHRQGNSDHAHHWNEESLLLFRSDQPGSIGKIVFSWAAVDEEQLALGAQQQQGENSSCYTSTPLASDVVRATIHVLSLKEAYRGYDFGGLLFSEAIACLKGYFRCSTTIQCSFLAKEDVTRHGQLVQFYQSLGATVKNRGRPSLVSNNDDGEIYRRVPMQLSFNGCTRESSNESSLLCIGESTPLKRFASFLPLTFSLRKTAVEKFTLLCDNLHSYRWVLLEQGTGELTLQPARQSLATTITSCSGSIRLRSANPNEDEDGDHIITCYGPRVWTLQFSATGSYVDADPETNELVSSKCPAFWETAPQQEFCLVKSEYHPRKWNFYRHFCTTQTVDFVRRMHCIHTQFDRCRMTLEEALGLASNVPANQFSVGGPSRRSLLFATAHLAKKEGYPDWIQFVALVHGLAFVVRNVGDSDFDWTLPDVDSRVVGCKATTGSPWSHMRCLSPDEDDSRYNTHVGMYSRRCGLEKVLLSWGSSEYMYYMLKHNKVGLPDEAFKLLKLGPLVDWHSYDKHRDLSTDEDERARQSASDFYNLCQKATRSVAGGTRMSDSECLALWQSHYSFVVRKYVGTSGKLSW